MKKLSKTASSIVWAFAYFGLVVALTISGCIAFHRYYYCSVFVSGTSMEPTLKGGGFQGISGTAHYGIIHITEHALKGIKRFDIITTYYPWDKTDYKLEVDEETGEEYYKPGHSEPDGVNPDRKIKRVLGLPGDTLRIINGDLIIGKAPVPADEVDIDTAYKFGALPGDYNDFQMKIYRHSDSNNMFYNYEYNEGIDLILEKSNKNNSYYCKCLLREYYNSDPSIVKYLNLHNDGEKIYFTFDMSPETIWNFNSKYKTITSNISGSTNESLNGTYVFATKEVDDFTFQLTKLSNLNGNSIRPFQLLNRDVNDFVVYSRELVKNNPSYANYELLKDYKSNYLFPFKREFDNRDYNIKDKISEIVLMEGRYWVQGDHWSSSTDCGDPNHGPIYYENIEGVLVAIEGTCEIRTDEDGKKECVNHKSMIPRLL